MPPSARTSLTNTHSRRHPNGTRRSSFPTTTPTTTATRWRSAGCSPSPAPSSRSPTSATPTAERSSRRRPRSCWPAAPPRSARPDMPRHVVVNPGTSVGLTELAERENADVIVFGSEYRTAPGTGQARDLGPQTAARRPGGDRRRPGRPARRTRRSASTRSASSTRATRPPAQTADSLAAALGASVAEHGARPGRPAGRRLAARRRRRARSTLSAASDYAVEAATYPVLVIPRGVALDFGARRPARLARPDDEDHGRDLRVAAVDPLRASALEVDAAAPWSAEASSATRLPAESASTTKAAGRQRPRWSRPASSDSPGHVLGARARRSPSPGRRRGRGCSSSGPRGSSARSRAAPTRGRRARRPARRARARAPSPQLLAAEVEGAGVAAGRQLTSTWKGMRDASDFARRRWNDPPMPPCPTPSSSTTTACCSTPSRSGPGPSRTSSSGAGIEFTPADKRELVGTSAEIAGGILERRLGEPGRAAELIEELNELVVAELEHGVEAMVGARELLHALQRARHADRPRLQLAAALRRSARCEIVGFEDHFDVVLSAHEVAAPKPAPDPYLEACRRLGVEPGPDGGRAGGLADRRRRCPGGRPDRDRRALDRGDRARGGAPPRRVAARRGRRHAVLSARSLVKPSDVEPVEIPLSHAGRGGGAGPARRSRAARSTLRSLLGVSSPRGPRSPRRLPRRGARSSVAMSSSWPGSASAPSARPAAPRGRRAAAAPPRGRGRRRGRRGRAAAASRRRRAARGRRARRRPVPAGAALPRAAAGARRRRRRRRPRGRR